MSNTKKSAGGTAIPSAETKKSSKDIIRLAEGKVKTFIKYLEELKHERNNIKSA